LIEPDVLQTNHEAEHCLWKSVNDKHLKELLQFKHIFKKKMKFVLFSVLAILLVFIENSRQQLLGGILGKVADVVKSAKGGAEDGEAKDAKAKAVKGKAVQD
jgi:hypothetical protein